MGEIEGEIETEEGVLVIRRIHARYRLRADEAHAAAIQRAFEAHAPKCPVYRTLSGCIDITTELELLPPA